MQFINNIDIVKLNYILIFYLFQCLPNEVKNIKFKFKRGSVPPMMPTE